MICPNCGADLSVTESIHANDANYRHYKCPCGSYFFSKEELVADSVAKPVFQERNREKSKKFRMKQKGVDYEVKYSDGRERKQQPKRKLRPLF